MKPSVNKRTLVRSVADRAGVSAEKAEEMVDTVLEVIASALVDHTPVMVTGFGTFDVRETVPRKGRNPKTGEEIDIPARNRVVFRSGERLKAYMRGEKTVGTDGKIVGKLPKGANRT